VAQLKGEWVSKSVARQHSEFEFRHPSKIINGRHKQRSGQHILPAKKILLKIYISRSFSILKVYFLLSPTSLSKVQNFPVASLFCQIFIKKCPNSKVKNLNSKYLAICTASVYTYSIPIYIPIYFLIKNCNLLIPKPP
jgi:hypothetical protein